MLVKTCESLDKSERRAMESRVSTDQKRKERDMWTGGDGHIKRTEHRHDVQHPWAGRNSLCMGSGELPTTMWPATPAKQHVHVLADRRMAPRASGGVVQSPPSAVRACVATIQIARREPQASPSRLGPSVEIPRGGLMSLGNARRRFA